MAIALQPSFLHTGDAAEYQRISANVLAGRGFSSAAPGDPLWHPLSWRTPGYPLFLAAHTLIFGEAHAPLAARITQAAIDATTVLLVIALGREIGLSAFVAWLAGLLYAIHPLACLQVVPLGTEALVAFLLTAAMLLSYRAVDAPRIGRGLAIGLLFGALLMVRPTAQFFAPILFFFLLAPWRWQGSPPSARRTRLLTAIAFAIALVLALVPWTARNYRVHGAFVPFSTLGGVVLYEGVSGIRIGDWWSMPGLHSIPAEDWAKWRELGEVAGEKHMRERAVGVIRAHPVAYLKNAGFKLVRFWLQVSAGYGRLSWRSWAAGALQAAILFLAGVAFIRYRGPWVRKGLVLWLLVLYHSALYSLTVAEVRYSYVLLPYVLLPAALTLGSHAKWRPAADRAIMQPPGPPPSPLGSGTVPPAIVIGEGIVKQLFMRATLTALAAVFAHSLILAGSPSAYAAPVIYEIDPAHSAVTFKIRHLMSKVPGAFGKFKGTIVYDAENPSASSVDATIESASIDTNNEKRDGHLRAADFFEVEKYPTIDFKSKSVAAEGTKLTVNGDLTMHGVTKPVTLTGEVGGVMKDPTGKSPARAGFSLAGTVNRKDFGIIWNKDLDQSTTLLGDDVAVELDIEAIEKVEKAEEPKAGEPAQAATSTK